MWWDSNHLCLQRQRWLKITSLNLSAIEPRLLHSYLSCSGWPGPTNTLYNI